MALVRFAVSFKNFKRLEHTIDRYGQQLQDLRPFWALLEKYLARPNALNIFIAGQREWKPLNPYYLAWKKAHGFSPDILVRESNMFKAFSTPGYAGNLSIKEPREWRYGVKIDDPIFNGKTYPVYHNTGTSRLAKREWCYITKWMEINIRKLMYRYLMSIIRSESVNIAGFGKGF